MLYFPSVWAKKANLIHTRKANLIHTRKYIYIYKNIYIYTHRVSAQQTTLSEHSLLSVAQPGGNADEIQLSGTKELTQLARCIPKPISHRWDPIKPQRAIINELSTKPFGFLQFSVSETVGSERFWKNNPTEGSAQAQILAQAPCNQEIMYFRGCVLGEERSEVSLIPLCYSLIT